MNVAVLGTGTVGRTIAGKVASMGHHVRIGTRDVDATMARTEGDPPFAQWAGENPAIPAATYADAAAHGEVVFNATSGLGALDAMLSAADGVAGKVVLDLTNPLDFSHGFPPQLTICNDDSLAERMQRAVPEARIVKTLNTVNASVMVDPASVAGGEHDMFVAGNDVDAKRTATTILTEWFGWKHVTDLGDLSNARGMEMYVPLWVRLYAGLGTGAFNVRIVR